MKSLKTVACCHTSSSSLPSMTGGLSKRVMRMGTDFSEGIETLCVELGAGVCAVATTTAHDEMRISRSDLVISTRSRTFSSALRSLTEALADKIGHFDEKCSTVATEAWFKLAGERIKAVAIHVVIVADIKRSAGIWRPAKKKL